MPLKTSDQELEQARPGAHMGLKVIDNEITNQTCFQEAHSAVQAFDSFHHKTSDLHHTNSTCCT